MGQNAFNTNLKYSSIYLYITIKTLKTLHLVKNNN